jgi:hypothetical protein
MLTTTIATLFTRRVTPRGWIAVPVAACTPRIALVHTRCGHRSAESWEFSDDPGEFAHDPIVRRYCRDERRRMRHIARDYATAHDCAEAQNDPWAHYGADYDPWVGYQTEDDAAAEAETLAWLDAGTVCPFCTGDGAPTGRAVIDEDASDEHTAPVEIEYRCGSCWSFYTKAKEGLS